MYRTIILSIWLCLSLFVATPVLGSDLRELQVELSYSGSAVYYNLYKNGNIVCDHLDIVYDPLNGPLLTCIVALDPTPMTFTLTAVDAAGVESLPSAPFPLDPLPQANFTTNVTGLAVSFDASSSSDYRGFITSYAWNFGDGRVGTGQFINHTFAAAGTYAVRLTVANGIGAVGEKASFISVPGTSVNRAPIAGAVNLAVTEDVVASGKLPGSDPDGNALTYSIVINGTRGTARITNTATGAFTYTPTANINGSDSFTYRVSDGALTASATVTVTTAAVNDAPTATAFGLLATEDVRASGQLRGADLDGNPLTYAIVTNGVKGTATITNAATGAFTYTPQANKNGVDTFVYRVSDGVLTASATVTVTIAAVNDAPTATAFSLLTTEDVKASGQLRGADLDGNPLTYAIVTNGVKGTATITNAATGAFTYTPQANKNGVDTFVYRVSDGVLTASATVTVTIAAVSDPPRAAGLTLPVTEDVVASGQLPGSDPDGNALTYSIVTNGTRGAARITNTATGAFTYTPAANINGSDSFTYRVSDGALTASATVTVTIAAVNDAPRTSLDAVQVESGKQVLIDVLANDADVDGPTLSVAAATTPAHGQAVIVNGIVSYTAHAAFIGTDSFSYTINDGAGKTATGTVTVTVLTQIPMQSVTYKWDYPAMTPNLAGFKLYLNGGLACATSNPAARTLTCKVPKNGGAQSFHLIAISFDTTETTPSNSLKFTP